MNAVTVIYIVAVNMLLDPSQTCFKLQTVAMIIELSMPIMVTLTEFGQI